MCMIFGEDLKELEIQSVEISKKIVELTHSEQFNIDELNALKADRKHINDQINRIKGKNISEDTKLIKDRKIVYDKKNIDRYFKIKKIFEKESSLTKSVNRLIFNIKYTSQIPNEKVKVR